MNLIREDVLRYKMLIKSRTEQWISVFLSVSLCFGDDTYFSPINPRYVLGTGTCMAACGLEDSELTLFYCNYGLTENRGGGSRPF
jgi:hypothetical protein